jgi:DMSO/TMAO reductase YedYZ molybdopterin-dependent catalytic subunit
MKRLNLLIVLLVLALALTACGGDDAPADAPEEAADTPAVLTLTDGDSEQTFDMAALEAMPQTTANAGGTDYVGVTLADLLAEAEIDPADLSAVKAVASDGFSANYDSALYMREDVILAYAEADGPLPGDSGPFRMVLPGEAGNLNVRMVVEIEVIR